MTDVMTVIRNDHQVIERIFNQIRSGQGDRKTLLNEVGARLEAHGSAEEEHVYPEIGRAKPSESKQAQHGYEEHREAFSILDQLKGMGPADPQFDGRLNQFIESVRRHAEEEESQILPVLAASVPPERLEQMGQEFERHRKKDLAAHGIKE